MSDWCLSLFFCFTFLNLDEVDSVDEDDTNNENNAEGNEPNQNCMDDPTQGGYEFGSSWELWR